MFFVLSKLLLFLLAPFNWVVACFLYAAMTRVERRRRLALRAGLVFLLVFSNPLLVRMAYLTWEVKAVGIDEIDPPCEVAIVLGGFSNPLIEPRDRLHFTADSNRLTQAIELYREGKVRRILVSGGSGAILGEKAAEAGPARRFLLRIGLPEEDVLIESSSRNTRENALASAERLAEFDDRGAGAPECVLVTSAFHMRRARACFRKAGVRVVPFATDIRSRQPNPWSPGAWLLPAPVAFDDWTRIIKEWIGTVVYKLRGWA